MNEKLINKNFSINSDEHMEKMAKKLKFTASLILRL